MKKFSYMLFLTISFLVTIVLSFSLAFAQPNLQGTWKVSLLVNDLNDGEITVVNDVNVDICQYEDTAYDVPFLYWPSGEDPPDPFFGFVRDNIFTFFKHIKINPSSWGPNYGRETIIGEVNPKGHKLTGSGNGFDSNPNWGSSWNLGSFTAKKISDDTQGVCPEENPWFCFYPDSPGYPCQ